MRPLHVLVPLDTTDLSLQVLPTVHELAAARGEHAEVVLCHVVAPGGDAAGPLQYLQRQATKLASKTLTVSCMVAEGSPADVILQQIRSGHFDFVCLTTRAKPGRARRPGSVAQRLIRESPTPVVVLAPEQAHPAAA